MIGSPLYFYKLNNMSAIIATNFSYKGEEFLDSRQNQCKRLSDLKNWDTPVPDGFETCIDGIWYIYDSSRENEETGHWFTRVSDSIDSDSYQRAISVGAVKDYADDINATMDTLQETVNELDNKMFPPSITAIIGPAYTGTGELDNVKQEFTENIINHITNNTYSEDCDFNEDRIINEQDIVLMETLMENERVSLQQNSKGTSSTYWIPAGSWILPEITWTLNKKGEEHTPIRSTVTAPIIGTTELNRWVGKEGLESNTNKTYTFTITSWLNNKNSATTNAYIKFGYKYFIGTSTSESLGNNISYTSLSGFTSWYTETGTMSARSFDCSGGKYAYILVPQTFWRTSYKTYVGGFYNSDFNQTNVNIVNERGVAIPYVQLRTGFIQTGSSIVIEIK